MLYCVIGDRDSILGYQLAGAEGWPVHDVSSARQAFRQVVLEESCRILLIAQPAAAWLADDIDAHRKTGRTPLITAVDGLWAAPSGKPPTLTLAQRLQSSVGIRPAEKGS